MSVEVAAISNIGPTRTENQDVVVAGSMVSVGTMQRPIEAYLDAAQGLVAVVDGMGGQAGGEVAARIVAEGLATVGDYALTADHLRARIRSASDELYGRMLVDPELRSMGATLAGVTWSATSALIFHVGDSRVYARFGSTLERLTTDHRVSEDDNVLSRSVGGTSTEQVPELDFTEVGIDQPTRFLCCTDGLSDAVDFATLEHHVATQSPYDCAAQLFHCALERGADDNISLVIVDLASPSQTRDWGVEDVPVVDYPSMSAMAEGEAQGRSSRLRRRPRGGQR